jgi:hypothetical protein
MLKLRMKQLLALFLCGLLAQPLPVMAEPAPAPPGAVLGSVTARGLVSVGEAQVPGMSALFSGDLVRTGMGSALIQYQDGVRVILGSETLASFSSSRVELQKGQMSFSTESGGPQFAASTLRLEPASAKSAANVSLADHKATVAVTEGSLRIVDPTGVQLASLRAGEARLFEEASAAAPSPAPPAAAVPPVPQAGGGTGISRAWLLVLGIGMVAIPLGIAKGLRGNDGDACGDELRTQLSQAQAQAAALQTQVRNLQTNLNGLSAAAARQNVVISNLPALLAEANRLETQVNDAQSRITRLLSDMDGPCGSISSTQRAELQTATNDLNTVFQATQTLSNATSQVLNQYGNVFSRVRLP